MKQKPTGRPSSSEQIIRDIKRKTRKQYGAEEKIRIVLDGLRGEESIAELCRREDQEWASSSTSSALAGRMVAAAVKGIGVVRFADYYMRNELARAGLGLREPGHYWLPLESWH